MNALVPPSRRAQPTKLPSKDSRLARVEVFDRLDRAEPYWRALEEGFATPYQRFDFLKLWQRHVGSAAGVTPFIVVGFDGADAPMFLWPFGCRKIGRWRLVEFLGGKHANFNMALWRCGAASTIEASDLKAVLGQLRSRADLLSLSNQPLAWAGTTNPFALLPHQRAANFGFSGALIPDFEALLRAHTNSSTRKKMRRKERALAEAGSVVFELAEGTGRIRHALDAFFKQKNARMRALGVPDAFAEAGVRRFIEAAASEKLAGGTPLLELYALSIDDMVVATMGGMVGGGRFCAMFNSITTGRHAVQSPGEQLILNLVRRCCERGLDTFDLGIGQAHYKTLFCGDADPLFDSVLPLNSRGHLLAYALRLATVAKRTIKQRPWLWETVRAVRRLRARLSVAP